MVNHFLIQEIFGSTKGYLLHLHVKLPQSLITLFSPGKYYFRFFIVSEAKISFQDCQVIFVFSLHCSWCELIDPLNTLNIPLLCILGTLWLPKWSESLNLSLWTEIILIEIGWHFHTKKCEIYSMTCGQ